MNTGKPSYKQKIWELIEPVVESEGFELVEVECLKMKGRWLVRLYVDREGGVGLDDCAGISHQVGDILDVYNLPSEPYTLEVSSPGLDRPLVRDKDFVKFIGSTVKIRLAQDLDGRKNFRGTLEDYIEHEDEKILVLTVEGRSFRIPRKSVAKANLECEL